MIFLVLTSVPRGLRGDLTRWLAEVSPGVFCGRVSRRVREKLWARVEQGVKDGCAVLVVANHDREQGYEILTAGRDRWVPVDFEGLTLMRRPGTSPAGPGRGNGPRGSRGPDGAGSRSLPAASASASVNVPIVPSLEPDDSGVFHVVCAEDWPYGIPCNGCGRVFGAGELYAQRPAGMADDVPVTELVCLACGIPELPGG